MNFGVNSEDYDCCPDCGMLMCPKHKAEHDAKYPPEPLPHDIPTVCLCGSAFKLVHTSVDFEHYECKRCGLPVDRQMR